MWRLLIPPFIAALSCQPATEQVSQKSPSESAELRSLEPLTEEANEAIRALQKGLVKALTSALEERGPEGAVPVCRDEAQTITAQISEETGITVGRTSHLLRNSVNAPPEWAKSFVEDGSGKKTSEVEPHVLDLGDRVGVLKPINTLALCVSCHGNVEAIDTEVKKSLAESYPTDRAVGFSAGDLRGWMWAEVDKEKR